MWFPALDKNNDSHVDFEEFVNLLIKKRHLMLPIQSIDTDGMSRYIDRDPFYFTCIILFLNQRSNIPITILFT